MMAVAAGFGFTPALGIGRQVAVTNRHAVPVSRRGRPGKAPHIVACLALPIASQCTSRPAITRAASPATTIHPCRRKTLPPPGLVCLTREHRLGLHQHVFRLADGKDLLQVLAGHEWLTTR